MGKWWVAILPLLLFLLGAGIAFSEVPRIFISGVPKDVVIGDRVFQIEYRQSLGDPDLLGICNYRTRTISVRTDEEMESTLIHEILHALDPTLTEKQVLFLESRIYEMFQLNYWIIGVKDVPRKSDN